ncbi:MAG: FHA domain-containing protein [Acidimicrobiia bacterium]|nr:FHA domain-containing protein [Acidimicrobiia bacterium]NNC76115.1 FHA domain-containing protein [Acidimicrobiia bacterium]
MGVPPQPDGGHRRPRPARRGRVRRVARLNPRPRVEGYDGLVSEISNPQFPPSDPDPDQTLAHPAGEPGVGAAGGRLAGAFRYALTVADGPIAGLSFVLAEGTTTIGRNPDNGIILEDVTVSRHHSVAHLDSDGLTVEDVGSTNGTYVNGERIEGNAFLRPGDELFIGKFHLVVESGDV